MKLHTLICLVSLWLGFSGCGESNLTSITPDKINSLLSQVNEDDPRFVEKGISFDSIITKAGNREISTSSERVKIKLFYYDDKVRGYFNLTDRDDKNLQFFGQRIEDLWVLKCVTKLNMQEVGGYIFLDEDGSGVWSNGDLNFKPQVITLLKSNKDYDVLTSW